MRCIRCCQRLTRSTFSLILPSLCSFTCNRGFNQFVTRNQVLDEANGFLGENETLYIECDITMQDSDVKCAQLTHAINHTLFQLA